MWTLTGFADEISPDVDEQIALLKTLGIRHIEFRSAWGTKVLDLTDAQLETAKQKLDAAGIALSSVGSDLGKIAITDPFEPHLARVRHGVDVAKFFDARYLRVFSFFMPDGEDPTSYRDDVLARTRAMVQIAEAGGITLLHENEKGYLRRPAAAGRRPGHHDRFAELSCDLRSSQLRAVRRQAIR